MKRGKVRNIQQRGGATKRRPATYSPRRQPMSYQGFWDGIARNTHRAQFPFLVTDADYTHSSFSRMELISASRKLYENDGVIRGAINTIADHAFPLVPKATTLNPDWNRLAEDYFRDWGFTRADITGEWDFDQIQRQLSIAIDCDGDELVTFTTHYDSAPAIQLFEAHKINSFHLANPSDRWKEGVKHNAVGRPTNYAITTTSGKAQSIPASFALLVKNTTRVRQRRGIPLISYALAQIKDKREILGHEKLTVKWLSSLMPYFTSLDGELDEEGFDRIDTLGTATESEGEGENPPAGPTETERVAEFIKKVYGTEVPILPAGVDLKQIQHDRPNTVFTGFLDYLIRDLALGVGIPYEFLVDPKRVTSPAMRSTLIRVDKGLRARQKVLAPFVRRTWAYVIGSAIDRGELPPQSGWYKCRIQPPRRPSIDAGRDAKSDRDDVSAGLMSRQEYFQNRDRDWDQETDQIFHEEKKIILQAKRLADETGIDLTLALARLSEANTPGTFTPSQTQSSPPLDDDIDDEDEDDEAE